jgi:adenine-specific DNA-methyltransferase
MERRLRLAKRLLNPECSVLIVTIDENEVSHLTLILDDLFPSSVRQMVTSVINPRGVYREGFFSRCNEYLLFVMIGSARVEGEADAKFLEGAEISWRTLRRSDLTSARGTAKGGARQFYPIYVNDAAKAIEEIGEPLPPTAPRHKAPTRAGCTAVFPVRPDGTEMNWGLTPDSLRELWRNGHIKVGGHKPSAPQPYAISYLTSGRIADISSGNATVVGHDPSGAVIAKYLVDKNRMPSTNWSRPTHNAETFGSNLLRDILGDKRFPFPKSIYAVADCIRFFTKRKKDALVL